MFLLVYPDGEYATGPDGERTKEEKDVPCHWQYDDMYEAYEDAEQLAFKTDEHVEVQGD